MRRIIKYSTFLLLATTASAGSRHFVYSCETTTMAQGAWEVETWVTWQRHKASDSDFSRFDFRHELEYGVTDRFQLALYFADWRTEKSVGTEFRDVALEAIYNMTDPNKSPLGSALYGEVKVGDDFVELEAKILLEKKIGDWSLVYNLGAEFEWENDYDDDEGELMQSAGVNYQFSPAFAVGVEALHEVELPDAERFGQHSVWVGPTASWQNKAFSIALAGLFQVTDRRDQPDFQVRTVFSVEF